MAGSNPMQQIYLDKVVVNIGIGQNDQHFNNAKMLIKKLTDHEAVATKSKRRIPELKLRKGQVIGAMVTLRNKEAEKMLKRALEANNNTIRESSIAKNSINFGVKEYIEFEGVKYDPKIGMLGLNINAAFARRGIRVERRKHMRSHVGVRHREIGKELLVEYISKSFGAKVGNE